MGSSASTCAIRQGAAASLRGLIEFVVLALVCVSPWVLGAVEPGAECCLSGGVAVLLMLWAARTLLEGRVTWGRCPVALGLAGLFLFGIFQVVPLPRPVLTFLSPATERCYEQLLPQRPELLPFGEGHPVCSAPAGSSLSVHPAATKRELVRLLAVFLLFAVVRNNTASLGALRRLSIAVLLNGSLLAVFAFAQFFSSPPRTLYWQLPVLNDPFGPFICRNHYPFYLNLCIGLGGGLLFSCWQGQGRRSSNYHAPDEKAAWLLKPLELLRRPLLLWLSSALAFLVASSVFSLSRGGFLSLTVTLVLGLLVRLFRSRGGSRLEVAVLIGTVVVALLGWFGMAPIQARLATVWQGEALEDSRLPLWLDLLSAAKNFPLFGTGYGSFFDVELAYRTRHESLNYGYTNAHNDYLEALTEGGLVRLGLSLLVIGLVYRLGWRALRRFDGKPGQALVGGALFAFTTVVIHSFVDFGLHIPAITVFVTVVCAQLSGLGAQRDEGEAKALRLGGLAPAAALAGALVLGGLLCTSGWRQARTYSLEVAARQLAERTDLPAQEQRLELLEAASRTGADRADIHLLAGQAYFDLYQAEQTRSEGNQEAGEWDRPARRLLLPALRHYLQARDLCPLLPKPHVRLAASVVWLERADSQAVYLRRAKQSCPSNPEVWYLAGALELTAGRPEEAWASWRRSLELSGDYLQPIIARAGKALSSEELMDQVLPAQAEYHLLAAEQLYSEGDQRRGPFLRKARKLWQHSPVPLTPGELHRRAQVEAALGDSAAALASYKAALLQAPGQTSWRVEYASLLRARGHLTEARRELQTVLADDPGNAKARKLLEEVVREITEGD